MHPGSRRRRALGFASPASPARLVALTLLVSFAAAAAPPAQASPETMKRALSNIALGPVDLALAPVTTAIGLYRNLRDVEDSPGVRLVYPIPAYAFVLGVNAAASAMRSITGLIELVPALPLLFLASDLDPLFDPVDDAAALVEIESEWLPLRFGINYVQSAD